MHFGPLLLIMSSSSGGASSDGASQKQGGASQKQGGASPSSGGASASSVSASKVAIAQQKIRTLQVPARDNGSKSSKLNGSQVPEVFAFWFTLLAQMVLNPSNVTILDAFGNVGGDAILMALLGMKVLSIELNETRFECLTRNVASLGLGDRITSRHCNFLRWLKDVKHGTRFNLVYLDPPWFPGNGPHKATKTYTDLFIVVNGSELVSVFSIITRIFELGLTDTIVLKIPPKSAFKQLPVKTKSTRVKVTGGGKFPQFLLLVINKDDYFEHLKSLQCEM